MEIEREKKVVSVEFDVAGKSSGNCFFCGQSKPVNLLRFRSVSVLPVCGDCVPVKTVEWVEGIEDPEPV